jgi:hypothetical protein
VEPAEQRAARRAFIRAHHPDAGGDAGQFIAGLRVWDEVPAANPAVAQTVPVRVHVIVRRPWSRRLLGAVLRRVGYRRRPPRVR